jgi:hypothetical protein
MDPRLKNLSYSSLLLLHSCPRKYQLQKLNVSSSEDDEDLSSSSSVTFAFGHIVGDGIQKVFEGYTEDQIFWSEFLMWDADLFAYNDKQKKSYWLGMLAIQKFIELRNNGFLDEYELVYHEGKPAVELGFCITFPDGFKLRGYVDAVLRHKITGEIVVLECKTTSATNLNAAQYKNSAQGVGYSVVLDDIFPELSSYQVLYLAYKTKSFEYELFPFTKSYLQRALWIQETLLDIETIKLYESAGVYPMHGESCLAFYRECGYYGICTLSTEHLTSQLTIEGEAKLVEDNMKYQVQLTLQDLINSQLSKA